MLSLFHEMRQWLTHPVIPSPLAGHAGLLTVTGLNTRVAAWGAAWNRQSRTAASPSSARRQSPISQDS
jgi:3-oxoacyl-[acyl-carrier-protein] synthase-1